MKGAVPVKPRALVRGDGDVLPFFGWEGVVAVLQGRALLDQVQPVAQELSRLPHPWWWDVGGRDEVCPQEVGQGAGIDGVGLNAGGGDDEALREGIMQALRTKPDAHHLTDGNRPRWRKMIQIGG